MPSRPVARPRPAASGWIACALLAAGTAAVFGRSLAYGFINYDDPLYVTANPYVQAGLTWKGVVWAFTGHSDYWHPLTWLSHMLDVELFGNNATGHRAMSVAWHAANAVLAFLLMRRLTGAWWTSLVSAALFAWHPLRVESVVWLTERKDVMSGGFFLLTLLAYVRYAERCRAGQPAGASFALTLALFAAGLMCKPSLVPVPLVLLALDCWPLGRLPLHPATGWWRMHRCVVLEKLPFLVLSGAIAGVTIRLQAASQAFILDVPWGDRLGNAAVSVARYLGNFFWPADLAILYEHHGAWPALAVGAATGLVAALTGLAWWQRARRPWLLAGWTWFVLMLLPALGLIQVGIQAMADRYTYLPALGVQLALLWTLRTLPLPTAAKAAGAGAALAACAGATWWQQGFWRDSESVFTRAVAMDPNSSHAEAFLAFCHEEKGNLGDAEHHARRAVILSADNQWAWLTLANIEARTNRLAQAADSYDRVIAINPRYTDAYLERARLLLAVRRGEAAETTLLQAAARLPESPAVFLALAEVQAQLRKFPAAATAYERVIALQPANAEAHAGLGYMRWLTGRRDDAVRHWETALQLRPDFPGLRERLRQVRP